MKIIGISGSPRKNGNTNAMIEKMLEGAAANGAETEIFNINSMNIKGCQACMYCRKNEGCALKDDMSKIYEAIKSADGVIIGSPVYMFQMISQTKTFMDRLYPYLNSDFSSKVNKNTVLLFTQGRADIEEYSSYFKMTADAFGILGFHVKEIITSGEGHMPGAVLNKKELVEKLLSSGKKLTEKNTSWVE